MVLCTVIKIDHTKRDSSLPMFPRGLLSLSFFLCVCVQILFFTDVNKYEKFKNLS